MTECTSKSAKYLHCGCAGGSPKDAFESPSLPDSFFFLFLLFIFFEFCPPRRHIQLQRSHKALRAYMAARVLCFAYYCSGHGKLFPGALS